MERHLLRSRSDQLGEGIAIAMALLTLVVVLPVRQALLVLTYVELFAFAGLEILFKECFFEICVPAFLLAIAFFAWMRSQRGPRNR